MKKENYVGLIYRNSVDNEIEVIDFYDDGGEAIVKYLDGRGPYSQYIDQILRRIEKGYYTLVSLPKKELYEIY